VNGEGQPVIVLAAGHGTRFGGPKAFAEHHGHAFLARILARCRETEARVTLVSDPRFKGRMEALLAAQPPPLPRVVEADGTAEMLVSVQAALRAGPYEPGFWLWPVDAPFVSSAGWRRAVEQAARDPGVIWKLRASGRAGGHAGGHGGHPTWFPFYVTPAILAGAWPDGLRGFLATQPPERTQVLTLEGEFLDDVDTPDVLAGLDWLE
jgi:molybdenum cofactor cytidylyltransferase